MKNIILPQIVAVGIYNSNFAIKNRTVSLNRKTTMFELELPIGEGGVSYIDEDTHSICENIVICAKPGQTRHTKLPFKCYYIHMMLNEGALSDVLMKLPNYIELSSTEKIKEIFISLCKHYNTGVPNDAILLQSLILELIYTLNKNVPRIGAKHNPKSNNHEAIRRTIEYINGNLSANLTLEALAAAANFSTIYFHKLFKASTGKTLREYIEEQRIRKAVSLLISTDMTLTQIAYECGFSSQSYFSYAFKKKMKIPPREYANSIHRRYEE